MYPRPPSPAWPPAATPDVDGLARLLAWSGLDPGPFMPPANEPEPLALMVAAVHSDQNLNPEARRALAGIVKTAYLQLRGPGPPREALRTAPERP